MWSIKFFVNNVQSSFTMAKQWEDSKTESRNTGVMSLRKNFILLQELTLICQGTQCLIWLQLHMKECCQEGMMPCLRGENLCGSILMTLYNLVLTPENNYGNSILFERMSSNDTFFCNIPKFVVSFIFCPKKGGGGCCFHSFFLKRGGVLFSLCYFCTCLHSCVVLLLKRI